MILMNWLWLVSLLDIVRKNLNFLLINNDLSVQNINIDRKSTITFVRHILLVDSEESLIPDSEIEPNDDD